MPDYVPPSLDPLNTLFWFKLAICVFAGGLVGLERQARHKAIGVRTSALVVLGTWLFVQLGLAISGSGAADPTRVLGQVITGVGFLGAGAIMHRNGGVAGLTTAATIWVLAGCGAAVALGYLGTVTAISVITTLLLLGLGRIEPDDSSVPKA